MSEWVKITIDDARLQEALKRLEQSGTRLAPAMKKIAAALADQVEENFAQQGRPRWQPLENPPERRQGGRILQDSGQLAASISTESTDTAAVIGSNKVYAAIHQFGGKTAAHVIRPVKKKALAFGGTVRRQVNHPGSDIPARPFLPVTADGSLQPEAKNEILQTILRHLADAAQA